MRKTKRTLRAMPPRARQIAEAANALNTESRRLHRIAVEVSKWERGEMATKERRVKLPGCTEHKEWQPDCDACYQVWVSHRSG